MVILYRARVSLQYRGGPIGPAQLWLSSSVPPALNSPGSSENSRVPLRILRLSDQRMARPRSYP